MPGWLQLTLAAIALARELIRYFDNKSKRDSAKQIQELTHALHKARDTHDTSDVERILRNV